MRYVWLVTLLGTLGWAQENVNSRYTVESVEISGVPETRLSKGLRARMQELIGQKFSQQKVSELARSIRKELPGRSVSQKIARGLQLDHVKVIFESRRHRREHFDFDTLRALYHSRQGWSGDLSAGFRIESSVFRFGIVSDADPLVERYAGVKAGYEKRGIGTDRLRLAFQFESYHQMWNRTTLSSPDPGIYRTRQNFQPQLTVLPARGLRLSFGASFQRFQTQFPAARTEASNAAIGTLRYDRSLEDSASNTHRFEAGYSLRAATRTLDSDFVYARHTGDFRYTLSHHRNRLIAHVTGGVMNGRAPLFERFVLGNSTTLRGWNKFDVAPLGGDRVAHGALEYGYGDFRLFYDTGAVWTHGQQPEAKHSIGLGFRMREFFLAVAFPVRAGRAEPIFMTGVNF
ncbi:MAG: BamA/TamA family outer membrane protein [Acidobacteriota bacterium]